MKELLTASRMASMLTCPRAHFWRYENGLKREESATALRFGSAWHRAMQKRWEGYAYRDELFEAMTGDEQFDELTLATLSGLLLAYLQHYGDAEAVQVKPEHEFELPIAGSRTFNAAGKIDGLGVMPDGTQVLVEHKTCGQDIGPDSDYWLRLRANPQLFQYVDAARAAGWEIRTVIYDVVRKPSIRPKQIPLLDEEGLKVVLDNETGERVRAKNGKPRQSAGQGMTLQTREESPEEYSARLYEDACARPEFYFQRREVPILDDDLQEFCEQRVQVARMILDRRRQQRSAPLPERAWPRNLNGMTCPFCAFSEFCLQNVRPDLNHPPVGFTVQAPHEELEHVGTNAA